MSTTLRPSLRVVTLNLWGIEPPLDRRLALALDQFETLAPDVICLQEVRPLDGVTGRTTAHVIADRLGLAVHFGLSVAWDRERPGQEGSRSSPRSSTTPESSRCPRRGPATRAPWSRRRSRPRADRSGSTRPTCTTGSTTGSRASIRCSRSTPRSGAWDATPPIHRRSCAATSTRLRAATRSGSLRGLTTLGAAHPFSGCLAAPSSRAPRRWTRRRHYVVERERAVPAAALARYRSPDRLRVRDQPQA